jgi:alkylhydroperoxidase/carboxymuconolactone decarboxylase family protein YurZ
MANRNSVRPATPEEIAAYRAAVAPHIGNAKAVYQVRYAHKIYVKSTGVFHKA